MPILIQQMPWADVKKEMTVEKGLDEAVADKIGEYVGLKGMSISAVTPALSSSAATVQSIDGQVPASRCSSVSRLIKP